MHLSLQPPEYVGVGQSFTFAVSTMPAAEDRFGDPTHNGDGYVWAYATLYDADTGLEAPADYLVGPRAGNPFPIFDSNKQTQQNAIVFPNWRVMAQGSFQIRIDLSFVNHAEGPAGADVAVTEYSRNFNVVNGQIRHEMSAEEKAFVLMLRAQGFDI